MERENLALQDRIGHLEQVEEHKIYIITIFTMKAFPYLRTIYSVIVIFTSEIFFNYRNCEKNMPKIDNLSL